MSIWKIKIQMLFIIKKLKRKGEDYYESKTK